MQVGGAGAGAAAQAQARKGATKHGIRGNLIKAAHARKDDVIQTIKRFKTETVLNRNRNRNRKETVKT